MKERIISTHCTSPFYHHIGGMSRAIFMGGYSGLRTRRCNEKIERYASGKNAAKTSLPMSSARGVSRTRSGVSSMSSAARSELIWSG